METTDYTKEMPVRPFPLDHGQLFTSKSRHVTMHCPRCFRAIRNDATQCKCGQQILSK